MAGRRALYEGCVVPERGLGVCPFLTGGGVLLSSPMIFLLHPKPETMGPRDHRLGRNKPSLLISALSPVLCHSDGKLVTQRD